MLKWTSQGTLNGAHLVEAASSIKEIHDQSIVAIPSTESNTKMENKRSQVHHYSDSYNSSSADKSAAYNRRHSLTSAPNSPASVVRKNKILGPRSRSISLPSSPQKSESKESTTKKKGVMTKFKNLFRRTSAKTKDRHSSTQPDSPKISIGWPSPMTSRQSLKEPEDVEVTDGDLVLSKQSYIPKTRLTRLIETKRNERKLNRSEWKTESDLQTQSMTARTSTSYGSVGDSKEQAEFKQQTEEGEIDHFLSPGRDFYQALGGQLPLETVESATKSKGSRKSFCASPDIGALGEKELAKGRTRIPSHFPKDSIFHQSASTLSGEKLHSDFYESEVRDKRWSSQSDSLVLTNVAHDYSLKQQQESSFHKTASKNDENTKPVAADSSKMGTKNSPSLNKSYGSDLSLMEYGRSLVAMLEAGSSEKVKVMPSSSDKIQKVRSQLLPTASPLPCAVDSSTPESTGKTADVAMGRGNYRWSIVDDDRLVISPIQSHDQITREDDKADSPVTSVTSVARNNNNGRYAAHTNKTKTEMLHVESKADYSLTHKNKTAERTFQGWDSKYQVKQNPSMLQRPDVFTGVEDNDVRIVSSSRPRVKDIVNNLEKEFEISAKKESPETTDQIVKAQFPCKESEMSGNNLRGIYNENKVLNEDAASENSLKLPMAWLRKGDHNAPSPSAWTDSDAALNSTESVGFSLILDNASPYNKLDSKLKETTKNALSPTFVDSHSDSSSDYPECGRPLKKGHESVRSVPGYESESFTNDSDTNAHYSDDSELDSSICNLNLAENGMDNSWSDSPHAQKIKTEVRNYEHVLINSQKKNEGRRLMIKDHQLELKLEHQSQDCMKDLFRQARIEDHEEGITDVKEPKSMLKEDSSLLDIDLALDVTADILHLQSLCPTINTKPNDYMEQNSDSSKHIENDLTENLASSVTATSEKNYQEKTPGSNMSNVFKKIEIGVNDDTKMLLLKAKKKVSFKLDILTPDVSTASDDMALLETMPVTQLGAGAITNSALQTDENASLTDVSSSLSAKSNDGQPVSQITSPSVDDVTWLAPEVVEDIDFYHDHAMKTKTLISETNITQASSSESAGTHEFSTSENTDVSNATSKNILTISSFLTSKTKTSSVFEIGTLQLDAKPCNVDEVENDISFIEETASDFNTPFEISCNNGKKNVTNERKVTDEKENSNKLNRDEGVQEDTINEQKTDKTESPEYKMEHQKSATENQETMTDNIEVPDTSVTKTNFNRQIYDKKGSYNDEDNREKEDSPSRGNSHTYTVSPKKFENEKETFALRDRPTPLADLDDSLASLEIDNDESSNISECVKQILRSPHVESSSSHQDETNIPFWQKPKTKFSKFDRVHKNRAHQGLSTHEEEMQNKSPWPKQALKSDSCSGKAIPSSVKRSSQPANETAEKTKGNVSQSSVVQVLVEVNSRKKESKAIRKDVNLNLKTETPMTNGAFEPNNDMTEKKEKEQQSPAFHNEELERKLETEAYQIPAADATSIRKKFKGRKQNSKKIKVQGASYAQEQTTGQQKECSNSPLSGESFAKTSEKESPETYHKCTETFPIVPSSGDSNTSADTKDTDVSDCEEPLFFTDSDKNVFQLQGNVYQRGYKLTSDSSSYDSQEVLNDMEFKMCQEYICDNDKMSSVRIKKQLKCQQAGSHDKDHTAQFMNMDWEYKAMSCVSDDGSGDCWDSNEDTCFGAQHQALEMKILSQRQRQANKYNNDQIRSSPNLTPEVENDFANSRTGDKERKAPSDVDQPVGETTHRLTCLNKKTNRYSLSSDSPLSQGLPRRRRHEHEKKRDFQGAVPKQGYHYIGKSHSAGLRESCICECQYHNPSCHDRDQEMNPQCRREFYEDLGSQSYMGNQRTSRQSKRFQYDQSQQSYLPPNGNQTHLQQNQQGLNSGASAPWNLGHHGSQPMNDSNSMSGASSVSKSKLDSKPGEWLFIATFFVFQFLMHWIYSR